MANKISKSKDTIRRQWEAFLQSKKIDEDVISPHILESWKRSKEAGVDPQKKPQDINHITQIFSLDSFIGFFNHILKPPELDDLVRRLNRFDCAIFMYDTSHRYFGCFYEHGNDLKGQQHVSSSMKEALVGTNAVACCIQENKPVSVVGEEHFIHDLKTTAGYAVPIDEKDERFNGVFYIVTDATSANSEILDIAIQLAEVFQENPLLYEVMYVFQIYLSILEGVMEHTNDSKFFIDNTNVVHGYNQSALKLLGVDRKSSGFREEILEKLEQIGAYRSEEFHEQMVFLKTKNKQKSLLASNQRITLSGVTIGTIVSLVDIERLSKWDNKIKGNQATYTFDHIIGATREIGQLKAMARKVSKTSSHVLIHGESGTGKELLAQAIHNDSLRSDRPFIAINCGAIPTDLIESELFGYEAGAFTGAVKSGKVGKMEFASGGTLFLDEIESMPLSVQIKLLRVLSTNRITRVGGLEEIPVDLRVIAATKKDLLVESREGNFREDLYYRIQVMELKIPPLRDRKEDIRLIMDNLIQTLLKQLSQKPVELSKSFMDAVMGYHWPGNIRELNNVVERALILRNNETTLTLEHLTDDIVSHYTVRNIIAKSKNEKPSATEKGLYHRFERLLIENVLEEENGNMASTAKRLGLSRQTMYRKLRW